MGICASWRRRERKAPEKWLGGPVGARKGSELLPRQAAMANAISNINLTNPIKGMVSKRRKRYIKDGFNLDLAYITERLIAMGFPAEKLEGYYRNHIDEVYRFLEQKHQDHYKIYNLCAERSYDSSKFHERVERYAFEDHAPPEIGLIQPFCEDVDRWLKAHPKNVAVVHCKAGKGRTGTMVCCYLLYSGEKATAEEALNYYGTKRAHDEKGVTIPSQRRYVSYYAALLRGSLPSYRACAVHVREILLSPAPALAAPPHALELSLAQLQPPLKAPPGCHEVRRQENVIRMLLNHCTPVSGDVRVEVYTKPKMMRKEKLFHFWFNTFFVTHEVHAVRVPAPIDSLNLETFKLTLNKWQLDDAHKDKQNKLYSSDFKVELILQKQPDSSRFTSRPAPAASPASSCASSCSERDADTDQEAEHWDSGSLGARGLSPVARYRPLSPEPDLEAA